MNNEINIFGLKDEFYMTHTESGMLRELEKYSSYRRKLLKYDNLHIMKGLQFEGKYQLPKMDPYDGTIDLDLVNYRQRNASTKRTKAVHWFTNDYCFDGILWHRLDSTTHILVSSTEVTLSPDYSLILGEPMAYNLHQIYKTRLIGAHWQRCGLKVIPTASWGAVSTFDFCFDGLPQNSVIAVCGTTHRHKESLKKLWYYGLRELEDRLHPLVILVYGSPEDIPGLHTEVRFYQDFIHSNLRKIKNGK